MKGIYVEGIPEKHLGVLRGRGMVVCSGSDREEIMKQLHKEKYTTLKG